MQFIFLMELSMLQFMCMEKSTNSWMIVKLHITTSSIGGEWLVVKTTSTHLASDECDNAANASKPSSYSWYEDNCQKFVDTFLSYLESD